MLAVHMVLTRGMWSETCYTQGTFIWSFPSMSSHVPSKMLFPWERTLTNSTNKLTRVFPSMNSHVPSKMLFPWQWMLTNFTDKLTLRTTLCWAFNIFLYTTGGSKSFKLWIWTTNIKVRTIPGHVTKDLVMVLIQINMITTSYTTNAFKVVCICRWHQRFCHLMYVRTDRGLFLRTGGCYLLGCLIKVFQITTWKNTRMRHSACWNILTLHALVPYIHRYPTWVISVTANVLTPCRARPSAGTMLATKFFFIFFSKLCKYCIFHLIGTPFTNMD